MLKKITALLLITTLSHAYAITPSKNIEGRFDRSLEELNYSLNVQWDQKDSKFFENTMNEFEKSIEELQKDGLSNSELVALSLEKIKDKQIQSEVATLAKVIDEASMTNEEAREFVLNRLAATYTKGASWSGHRMGYRTAMIVGLILVILHVCHERDRDHDHHHDSPTHGGHGDGHLTMGDAAV